MGKVILEKARDKRSEVGPAVGFSDFPGRDRRGVRGLGPKPVEPEIQSESETEWRVRAGCSKAPWWIVSIRPISFTKPGLIHRAFKPFQNSNLNLDSLYFRPLIVRRNHNLWPLKVWRDCKP